MTDRRILWLGVATSLGLTALIWALGWIPAGVPKLPDQGPSWYYWKLPEPTFWSRATAWGFYIGHQVAVWALLWWAQRSRPRYSSALHPVNWWMLAVNLLFIGLHFVQTYVWYDGLAQDVSIFSSQGSVVLLLVFVLIMETPRRGLLFGKKVPFRREFVQLVKRQHGYLFSWAAIYTFWYHPMEAGLGHLIGFFYMFLLLLQGSLIYNRAHINRWWTFALEVMVLVHGTLVAVFQGNGIWPMFFFGFFALVVVTQMYGLPIGARGRWLVAGAFVAGVVLVYGVSGRGWAKLDEIVRIPLIDFALVGVIYLLWLIGFWTWRGLSALRGRGRLPGSGATAD